MSEGLTDTERDQLLTPCDCGHSINDHGSMDTCWRCGDDNLECGNHFEDLLVARVGVIVEARVAAREARAWEVGRADGHRELRPTNAFGDTEAARNPYRAAVTRDQP